MAWPAEVLTSSLSSFRRRFFTNSIVDMQCYMRRGLTQCIGLFSLAASIEMAAISPLNLTKNVGAWIRVEVAGKYSSKRNFYSIMVHALLFLYRTVAECSIYFIIVSFSTFSLSLSSLPFIPEALYQLLYTPGDHPSS